MSHAMGPYARGCNVYEREQIRPETNALKTLPYQKVRIDHQLASVSVCLKQRINQHIYASSYYQ